MHVQVVPFGPDRPDAWRFAVEFLRINPPWILGLTPQQWFALASVLVGTGMLPAQRLRHGATLEPAA